MSQTDHLLHFDGLFMHEVRDRAIQRVKSIMDGSLKGERAQSLHDGLAQLASGQYPAVEQLAIEAVDSTLHRFLMLLDERGDMDLLVRSGSSKSSIKDESDGLAGELYSDAGWIARFSRYR